MIGICSHDAGGAEILSSYVARHPGRYCYTLAGPAIGIFKRKLGLTESDSVSLEQLVSSAKTILCGTSWQSELELNAIDLARRHGKQSVAFLDHWVNYRERFIRQDRTSWPDEIWVGDEDALRIAKTCLADSLPIKHQPNPYFADITEYFALTRHDENPSKAIRILYVTEPTSEHALKAHGTANYFGYTEYDALQHTITVLNRLKHPDVQFRLRQHPAEKPGKYERYLTALRHSHQVSSDTTLFEDIANADWIIGASTMAMVTALYAGKKVFTSIPPGRAHCPLPQAAITPVENLVEPR